MICEWSALLVKVYGRKRERKKKKKKLKRKSGKGRLIFFCLTIGICWDRRSRAGEL